MYTGVYTEALTTAAAASWTSSSSSSSSSSSTSMDSFSLSGILLDESCNGDKVFQSDGEEKCTFEKEYEASDALVQISGMLVDAAQSCVIVIK